MEPKRTLHSGNLVRGRQKAFYDPQRYMELGTCFVREDGKIFILLKDGVHKIDISRKVIEISIRFIKKLRRGELLDFKDRGQRRKLQLYGDNGERES